MPQETDPNTQDRVRSMPCSAMNRWERARQERQYWMLSKSVEAQEERIAAHYTAFAHLAMQLRELTEARKHNGSTEIDDTIRYLTGKIREGHLMDFGIELKWPNAASERQPEKTP